MSDLWELTGPQPSDACGVEGLLTHSLKWGTHEWEADVLVTDPNTELSWTTNTWKQDLPEGKTTTLSYATDIFYLSHPGTYQVTMKLVPEGA